MSYLYVYIKFKSIYNLTYKHKEGWDGDNQPFINPNPGGGIIRGERMERNGEECEYSPPHFRICNRIISGKFRRLKHIEDTIKLIFLCLKKITLQKYFILIDKIKGEPKKKMEMYL